MPYSSTSRNRKNNRIIQQHDKRGGGYLALVFVLDLGDEAVELGAHGVGSGSTAGTLEVLFVS